MKPILAEGEEVVTAWAERAAGPGWTNQLVWMFIRTSDGYKLTSLQPEEWQKSPALCALFGVSVVVAEDMRAAVSTLMRRGAEVSRHGG